MKASWGVLGRSWGRLSASWGCQGKRRRKSWIAGWAYWLHWIIGKDPQLLARWSPERESPDVGSVEIVEVGRWDNRKPIRSAVDRLPMDRRLEVAGHLVPYGTIWYHMVFHCSIFWIFHVSFFHYFNLFHFPFFPIFHFFSVSKFSKFFTIFNIVFL